MRATPVGKSLPRLLIATLALTLGLGLAAPATALAAAPVAASASASASAKAPAPAVRPGLAPQSATGTVAQDEKAQQLPAHERPPQPVDSSALRQDYSKPAATRSAAPNLARSAPATCNIGDFTGRTGSALVQAIKAAGTDCVNTLFQLTGSNAHLAFQESQMATVAYALRDAAPSYPGDDSTQVGELVLYLRAGYFVQWYNAADVGTYGAALQTAIRSGLDAFYANSHTQDVTDANGSVLSEAVTLIDSAGENARYLSVLKRLLAGYNSTYDSSYSMLAAVNNVYTVLFRGHQNADFVAATEADPSIIDALYSFATAHFALLGTDKSYLDSNAGLEMSRFMQDATLLPKVRPLAKSLLDSTSMTGPTSGMWAGIAGMANEYEPNNCSYYGICDLSARLRAAILTIQYTCSPSINIVAQALNADQLATTCTSLRNQDAFFHNLVKDNGPVANDHNATIEVAVFHSSTDYQTYAGLIFGIDTNNGGMYLEGDPSSTANQPRFVAYEAEWVRPAFQIWNLNHEYTHYLDGRFDMYGDFTAGTSTADTIWWIEGLAEYVSYTYRNVTDDQAVADAKLATYKLSDIFANTYNSGQDRVYPWGYLSVRYMLQNHRADVDTLLGLYRSGDYAGALKLVGTTIGTRYDADWANFLAACAAGSCAATGTGNQPPSAGFTALVSDLAVSFTDSSTDPDGTIAARSWDFGDGTTSTAANPSKTYAAAGTYTVKLTVTDNQGATATTSHPVTVAGLPECTAQDARQLGQNCKRGNLAATTANYSYLFVYLPAGVKSLTITSSGGTGNADLYYNRNGWATTTSYTARATGAGNNHTLTITNPPAGWNYISLYATNAFNGVSVKTQY